YLKPADGSAEERPVADIAGLPTSWSSDGHFVLVTSQDPKTGLDIWAVPDPRNPAGDKKAFPVIATSFNEQSGQFSPDGRWIAYISNETPPVDVYVRPFSADGSTSAAKFLVSKGLSTFPRWSSGGKKLFYASIATFGLMAVDVDTSKGFEVL